MMRSHDEWKAEAVVAQVRKAIALPRMDLQDAREFLEKVITDLQVDLDGIKNDQRKGAS